MCTHVLIESIFQVYFEKVVIAAMVIISAMVSVYWSRGVNTLSSQRVQRGWRARSFAAGAASSTRLT